MKLKRERSEGRTWITSVLSACVKLTLSLSSFSWARRSAGMENRLKYLAQLSHQFLQIRWLYNAQDAGLTHLKPMAQIDMSRLMMSKKIEYLLAVGRAQH
jgi:hypothetical protein